MKSRSTLAPKNKSDSNSYSKLWGKLSFCVTVIWSLGRIRWFSTQWGWRAPISTNPANSNQKNKGSPSSTTNHNHPKPSRRSRKTSSTYSSAWSTKMKGNYLLTFYSSRGSVRYSTRSTVFCWMWDWGRRTTPFIKCGLTCRKTKNVGVYVGIWGSKWRILLMI